MKRSIYDELIKWKQSEMRKPLMMYGARQVGKTYIIKEFGAFSFGNLAHFRHYFPDFATPVSLSFKLSVLRSMPLN